MKRLSPAIRNQVYDFAKAGRKFRATYIVRKQTGLKSKEAKALVQQILAVGPGALPKPQTRPEQQSDSANLLPMLDEQSAAMVLEYTRNGKKIAAIKILRTKTGLGLKEARDIIEAL